MWLLVLSDWRFYASIPASKHHHRGAAPPVQPGSVLPRRLAAECALANAITINVHATSWIDCPEDRP